MRERRTDERLDGLNEKVDRGFERVETEIRTQRAETRAEFTALRGEMKGGFDALHRLLIRSVAE